MQVLITVNTESVPGITAARQKYNESLPQTVMLAQADGETPAQYGPNPDLIATDEQYCTHVMAKAIESWNKAYAPAPLPVVPPTVVNGVPQTVSFRQAKTELIIRGKWDTVLAYIDTIADPLQRELTRTEVLDSKVYERQRPSLIAMAKNVLGLTDTEIDEWFIAANLR